MEALIGIPPQTESERIQVLEKYKILDSLPDVAFDRITRLAAQLLEMPVALISLVDTDRIWFKSTYGLEVEECQRLPGFCSSTIRSDGIHVVEDPLNGDHTGNHPLVTGEAGVRFYAGAPLKSPEGYNLGTLCVMDTRTRSFGARERKALMDLAEFVMYQMEARLEGILEEEHQHETINTTIHDLKNPLSVLPLLADMIMDSNVNVPAIDRFAQQIKSASKRMARTIEGLLEASREESNLLQLRLQSVDLVKAVKSIKKNNSTMARKKEQKLQLSSEETCMVYADKRKLLKVIDNLINNAIKYSPFGSEVEIKLGIQDDMAVLEVRDQGPGLTRDDLRNLFRPFTSLSAKPTGGETSSGLGLSIAKNLVKAHRGKIHAKSEGPGKGSSFIVELPLSQEEE